MLAAGPFAACTASYTTPTLLDGSHTLSVRSTDDSANLEAPPVSYTWVIDTVAPDTTIVTKPTDPSTLLQGNFTFGSDEIVVTYECKLDSAAWAACFDTYTTTALTNGSHTLSVRATDAAGNTDATPATYTWQVNSPLPVTTIASKPANPSNSSIGNFTFTNSKTPVTYECNLDSVGWAACGATYSTPTLLDGSHTLQVRSTDAGANLEDPAVTYTWVIDTVPPNTTIDGKPANPSGSATGDFTFTSSETPSTFECKLDTGDWAACPATYTTPVLSNGTHTLGVRATDAAGNVDATPATYSWDIVAFLDGGTLDAQSLDSSAIDGTQGTTLDAEIIGTVDAEKLDAEIDAGRPDVITIIDVGQPVDVQFDNARADVPPEGQPTGPEPSPDTAPLPGAEPNPDSAAPVNNDTAAPANDDTAAPANADAAPVVTNLKVLGSGFCAITSSRTASPAGFLVLALAGLALLRRRRR